MHNMSAHQALASITEHLNGCHNVFLDMGANIGMHARFLFEPGRYPRTWYWEHPYAELFDRIFGQNRNLSALCTVEFEPNPRHEKRLTELQHVYAGHGWKVLYLPFGVSDHHGVSNFHLNEFASNSSANEDYAFSMYEKSGSTKSFRLKMLDVQDIMRRVGSRLLPDTASQRSPPIVMIKMDIEGGEFSVIPQMLTHGVLCHQVDYITMEFHTHWNTTMVSSQDTRLAPDDVRPFRDALMHMMHATSLDRSCRLKEVLTIDDESYIHDGQPLE